MRVRPSAGRTAVLGIDPDGTLAVALKAAPEKGRANAELIALLARHFGVPRAAITLLRGASGRRKLVRVEGAQEIPGT